MPRSRFEQDRNLVQTRSVTALACYEDPFLSSVGSATAESWQLVTCGHDTFLHSVRRRQTDAGCQVVKCQTGQPDMKIQPQESKTTDTLFLNPDTIHVAATSSVLSFLITVVIKTR